MGPHRTLYQVAEDAPHGKPDVPLELLVRASVDPPLYEVQVLRGPATGKATRGALWRLSLALSRLVRRPARDFAPAQLTSEALLLRTARIEWGSPPPGWRPRAWRQVLGPVRPLTSKLAAALVAAGVALLVPSDTPRALPGNAVTPEVTLAAPMPDRPFPEQVRPPCPRPAVAERGGCWVQMGNVRPPCGEWYDRPSPDGYCYAPLGRPPDGGRRPTSAEESAQPRLPKNHGAR